LTSSFYQQAQLECEANGFVWLADIEDETLTKTYPDLRTFARILVSPDYLTRAAIFEIVPGGPQGKVTRPPIQTRELISDTSDGASITTTTASTSNLLDPPPGLVRQNVPADTRIDTMMHIHQTAVDTYLSSHPGVKLEEIRNYEEATAAWQRSNDRQRARLNSQGGLSREEMHRFAGQNKEKLADEVHAEMRKIKQEN
jgi:predicted transcriptional regulator